jgi:hypothetical protein
MVMQGPRPLDCRDQVLAGGTPRAEVIGCFGEPTSTDKHMVQIEQLTPPVAASPGAVADAFEGTSDPPPGTPAELSEEVVTDSYYFEDGGQRNHGGSKAARILRYTAGDVFTLFLDQVIWMPVELMAFEESKHHAEVDYRRGDDGRWRVLRYYTGVVSK